MHRHRACDRGRFRRGMTPTATTFQKLLHMQFRLAEPGVQLTQLFRVGRRPANSSHWDARTASSSSICCCTTIYGPPMPLVASNVLQPGPRLADVDANAPFGGNPSSAPFPCSRVPSRLVSRRATRWASGSCSRAPCQFFLQGQSIRVGRDVAAQRLPGPKRHSGVIADRIPLLGHIHVGHDVRGDAEQVGMRASGPCLAVAANESFENLLREVLHVRRSVSGAGAHSAADPPSNGGKRSSKRSCAPGLSTATVPIRHLDSPCL